MGFTTSFAHAQTLKIEGFEGGLNLKAFPTQLQPNEAQLLNNAVWDKFGSLRRRKGWTHLTIPDTNASINGLFRYYKQDSNRYLLVGGDTALYRAKNDSTSFVKIKSGILTGGQFYFVTYNDKIYGTNSKMLPVVFDGSTLSDLGLADSSSYGGLDLISACSLAVIDHTKDWTTDEWVGYVCRLINITRGDTIWSFVVSNEGQKIKLRNYVSDGTPHWVEGDNIQYYLYSWYQEKAAIYKGDVDDTASLPAPNLDRLKIYERDTTFTDSIYKRNYIIKFLTGKDATKTSYLHRPSGDSILYLSLTEFGDVVPGDSYAIYQLDFWKNFYVTIYHNRLILASDSVNQNVIYYSLLSEPTNFSHLNLFTTFTPDGDVITGLATIFNDQVGQRSSSDDKLLIFKQNNLMGCDDSWTPYVIATGVGAVASRSIINCEGQFVGFAHTTGFYGTDGNKVTKLSEKIEPFWKNINQSNYHKIACGYNPEIRSIFCSVPYGSSTENDTGLIYNIDNQAWSTASLKASVFANQWGLQDTTKFIWGRSDTGWICKYGLSNLDNGVDSITLTYRSGEFTAGDITQKKSWREFYLLRDNTKPIYVGYYKDFGSTIISGDTITATGKNISRFLVSNLVNGKTLSWSISTKDPSITIGGVAIKFNLIGGL